MRCAVSVPELGMPFGRVAKDGAIAVMSVKTQSPPITACTPYHTHAMAARLKTGQREPTGPQEARR